MTPDPLALAVARVQPGTPDHSAIAEAWGALHLFNERLREARRDFEVVMLGIIAEYGPQTVNVGGRTMVFRRASETETRCRDNAATLAAALEATDVAGVAELLASNAWKHGACRKVLPADAYRACFERRERVRLVGAKVTPKLEVVDMAFLPQAETFTGASGRGSET